MDIMNQIKGFSLSVADIKTGDIALENEGDFFGIAFKILQSETGKIAAFTTIDGKAVVIEIYNDELRATITGNALDVFCAIAIAHQSGSLSTNPKHAFQNP